MDRALTISILPVVFGQPQLTHQSGSLTVLKQSHLKIVPSCLFLNVVHIFIDMFAH